MTEEILMRYVKTDHCKFTFKENGCKYVHLENNCNLKRDTRFSSLFVQKLCFSCFDRDFSKYFFAGIFLFGANFHNLFQI